MTVTQDDTNNPYGLKRYHPPLHPLRPQADMSRFYVVTTVANSPRHEKRFDLYHRFAEMCDGAGVKLITVEQAFGLRPFMVTEPNNPMHVQVRTVEELWHKENMTNIGMLRASEMGAREIAWVDADCRPTMVPRMWFEETWHQLQHYEFVQMWEWMQDLSLNHNPIGSPQPSFMANYLFHGSPDYRTFVEIVAGRCKCERCRCKCKRDDKGRCVCHCVDPDPYPYGYLGSQSVFGRPGLAWAANVDALNKVGRLMDFCIHGSGDWYTAYALVGMLKVVQESVPSSAYVRKLYRWQELCERWIKRDVGLVRGVVNHDFHGRKKLRQYNTRDSILVSNGFDPDRDIKYDVQGLLQLETWEPRQIRLRDQMRRYFAEMNGDSTTGGED